MSELDSFQMLVSSTCPPLETLITNFKEFIVAQVKNDSTYMQNGTLFYIEYDIPTGYVSKYGKEACLEVLEAYFHSDKIKRILYINNCDEDEEYMTRKLEFYKKNLFVKENMYARYGYEYDDDDYNRGNKIIVNAANADGILFPILISKN